MSLAAAAALFGFGVLLSAFFSGCETGFYRTPRIRLTLDARTGAWPVRVLDLLVRRPSLFVATLLVGNNLANYLTSLAIVQMASMLWGADLIVELGAPVLFSPLVFVYGELLPKSVFFLAPYRFLRWCGPLIAAFTVLFLPLSALLWVISIVLSKVLGESPQATQQALARTELHQVFEEGHAAGILQPELRTLAQGLIASADRTVAQYVTAVAKVPLVSLATSRREALRVAKGRQTPLLLVQEDVADRPLIGYVRVADLRFVAGDDLHPVRPLLRLSHKTSRIAALMELRTRREPIAAVENARGAVIGLVAANQLAGDLHSPLVSSTT